MLPSSTEVSTTLILLMPSSAICLTTALDNGSKARVWQKPARCGYVVVLCYIGLSGPDQSAERVAMRVSQGGHDVPDDKLQSRFSRTLANLRAAIARLPHVLIYDNSDLNVPYRQVAVFDHGQLRHLQEPIPEWLRPVLP